MNMNNMGLRQSTLDKSNLQVKESNVGKVLKLDQGHCEGPGVVEDGKQQLQQSAPSHQNYH